jgi:hypothetical protein
MAVDRRIGEPDMTEPKQGAVAVGVQSELDRRLSGSQSFDSAPSEHNFSMRNNLEIGPVNPKTVEIRKAKDAS